ncbi:hypothetical protein P692DRAFT_20877622 [Suillus brevipes Sb2]|nr:hypothetical protein P692DRAFT_20877622 [Suillus brevipes Sb2]
MILDSVGVRVTQQRELQSAFGIVDGGKSSRRSGTNGAKGKKKGKKGSNEDGDKDDSSPSLSDKETDSDQEHDNNEDGEETEEGTNLCTSQLLRKERLQKDVAHIDSLHVEILDAQKLFSGAMKLTSVGVLEALIKQLSINAHHRRQSLKGKKFPFDDSISPSDHLHVLHRAVENETDVSRIMRNKKFLVPSQGDKLTLLEAEARTRQRHQEHAREHDKKEELLDINKSPGK